MRDGTKIFARPAEGRTVPLVDGREWPAGGEWVDSSDRYYRRRLKDKDIVETDPPKGSTAGAPTTLVIPPSGNDGASDDETHPPNPAETNPENPAKTKRR